jgi:hypothetical protein
VHNRVTPVVIRHYRPSALAQINALLTLLRACGGRELERGAADRWRKPGVRRIGAGVAQIEESSA